MLRKAARTAIAAILLLAPPASAFAQHHPIVQPPVPQVVPQFNNPGPQIAIPRPGNQVEQLSPIESVRPRPGYVAPSSSYIRTRPIKSRQSRKTPSQPDVSSSHRHWYSICSNDDCSEPGPRGRAGKRVSHR
jgi:hypothetical protein